MSGREPTRAHAAIAMPRDSELRPAIVHLARHATPDWSRKDIRYDIPPGPPLTEQGEAEARLLGAYLRDQGVARVYASPLERTRRTAELVGHALDLRPIEEPAIAEWRRDEPETVVRDRFREAWERAAAESLDLGPVAMVTHGGPIRALLAALGMAEAELGHYRAQFDNRNPMPPAGVWSTVRERGSDRWRMTLSFAPVPFARPMFGREG